MKIWSEKLPISKLLIFSDVCELYYVIFTYKVHYIILSNFSKFYFSQFSNQALIHHILFLFLFYCPPYAVCVTVRLEQRITSATTLGIAICGLMWRCQFAFQSTKREATYFFSAALRKEISLRLCRSAFFHIKMTVT